MCGIVLFDLENKVSAVLTADTNLLSQWSLSVKRPPYSLPGYCMIHDISELSPVVNIAALSKFLICSSNQDTLLVQTVR